VNTSTDELAKHLAAIFMFVNVSVEPLTFAPGVPVVVELERAEPQPEGCGVRFATTRPYDCGSVTALLRRIEHKIDHSGLTRIKCQPRCPMVVIP